MPSPTPPAFTRRFRIRFFEFASIAIVALASVALIPQHLKAQDVPSDVHQPTILYGVAYYNEYMPCLLYTSRCV